MSTTNPSGGSSYGQILRSSSIVGGGEAVSQVIGLVRTKAVAVLLGPAGMGLVNLYVSAIGLLAVVAQLGINQSGVRAVAEANTQNDSLKVAQVAKTLRRACWLTGLIGWILAIAFAWPLSLWLFTSTEHTWALAILGSTILLTFVSSGQSALLNGLRRISDLARLQIVAAVLSTALAVIVYGVLGEAGIIPVIILTSAVQLVVSWYYSRQVQLIHVDQTWNETFRNIKSLVSLGIALMYTTLLSGIVGLVTRALITRELDLTANGYYQAAWAISGMLATFVLAAMGRDFYPRLTAVHGDPGRVNRLVNEQIEVGILLALPGLVATVAFAPLLVELLYSPKFLPSAQLLPYFAFGVYVRLVSWPLGFILLAKSESIKYAVVASIFQGSQIVLTLVLLQEYGLVGAAIAFVGSEIVQMLLYYAFGRHLVRFAVSASAHRLIMCGLLVLGVACLLAASAASPLTYTLAGLLTFLAVGSTIRGLSARLSDSNAMMHLLRRTPIVRLVCVRSVKEPLNSGE